MARDLDAAARIFYSEISEESFLFSSTSAARGKKCVTIRSAGYVYGCVCTQILGNKRVPVRARQRVYTAASVSFRVYREIRS